MGITPAADLAAGSVAMVGEARYTYGHIALCTNLFTKMVLPPGEKSKFIPKVGAVEAYDLTDGEDMAASQTLTITGTTHTTDEAGCKVIVTRKLEHNLKEEAFRLCGRVIGDGMGRKMDKDGLGLFSGINTGLGTAAATFSIGYLAAAVSQMMGQTEPVPQPYVCVLHPHTLNTLVDAISQPGTSNMPPDIQARVLQNYWAGSDKLYRVPIFGDGNITPDSLDDAYGAVFSKIAFIYLVGWEPDTWTVYKESLRGWEIGIVADYSMVEEDGTYGRYLLFDAAAPTS